VVNVRGFLGGIDRSRVHLYLSLRQERERHTRRQERRRKEVTMHHAMFTVLYSFLGNEEQASWYLERGINWDKLSHIVQYH
jgi:hypothetical protein